MSLGYVGHDSQPGGVGCMPAVLAVMFMLLFFLGLLAVVAYGLKDIL